MLDLEVVTPQPLVFSERADFVVLPGLEGEIGILPGHAPIMAQLVTGELRFRRGENSGFFAVSGGFAEVLENRVKVFAETAEMQKEIVIERARLAEDRAKKEIEQAATPADLALAQAALRRALLRLRVSEGSARRKTR